MFDNLRQPESNRDDDLYGVYNLSRTGSAGAGGRILGLTPAQLFIISVVLFVNVALLSCFALVVFEKIDLAKLF
ncbi:MAG: hypothetical protein RMK99_00290 [Anaerolineales bacterium]|nr:hypothetical protein [Anaerolineales bacterium]